MKELKRTPLFDLHKKNKARLIDFGGWEMPIQYKGIVAEHLNTREAVSLFDVSHMGEISLKGKDALKNLNYLTCNDASSLKIGQVQYSALLNQSGGVIDDLTVYRLAEDHYLLCVNASNIQKDFDWIKANLRGDLICENQSDTTAQVAIQGKDAEAVLQTLTETPLSQLRYYHCVESRVLEYPALIARMGYTGEQGYEIFFHHDYAKDIWQALIEAGKPYQIAPAGLGARDTLRLEVCFPLYGNDLDEKHNALESGLSWIVKFDKKHFIGKKALLKIKEKGIQNKLIRFIFEGRAVPRCHYQIFDESENIEIGEVTSGSSSPVLKKGIGMGYVKTDYSNSGTTIKIKIRDKFYPAKIIKNSFVKNKNN